MFLALAPPFSPIKGDRGSRATMQSGHITCRLSKGPLPASAAFLPQKFRTRAMWCYKLQPFRLAELVFGM